MLVDIKFREEIEQKNENINMKKRVYNHKNFEIFTKKIQETNWSFLQDTTDAQLAYAMFIKVFREIHDKVFPIKYIVTKINPAKPWLRDSLLKSIKTKNKLYALSSKMPSPLRIATYKKYRNKLNHILKLSEKRYYHDKFELYRNNICQSWSVLNYYWQK